MTGRLGCKTGRRLGKLECNARRSPGAKIDVETDLAALRAHIDTQAARIERLEQDLGILHDKDEIQRLQYCYGFFIDNRMFRQMADSFSDHGAWMEIGGRGRYEGMEHIHAFLLRVLGNGRWGLLKDEVINHVQQQLLITVDEDRQRARAHSAAASYDRDQSFLSVMAGVPFLVSCGPRP